MKKFLLLLLLSLQCGLYNISLAQQPGDLDNSFNAVGYITAQSSWMDIAVQPDGKVLAVSNKIARYNTDGTLDGTFGSNGIVTIGYYCNAIKNQPDGKIVVIGQADYMGQKDFLLIRYNPDGSLDNTFDGDGIVLTDFNSGSNDNAYELAIQSDGKIIVVGASDEKFALCRHHQDGSLDNTFDNDGRSLINSINVDTNYWGHPTYMKLQTDGKILAGSGNILTRLNIDGSFDNVFGTNALVTFSIWLNDLAIQPNGKIILAGSSSGGFALGQLDTNGNFDNNFGNGGITITNGQTFTTCGFPDQVATSITLQPDGRILAGGYNVCCQLSECRNFVVVRYEQDGSLDSSFGTLGQVITAFPQFEFESESHASAITPDLKLVIAGRAPRIFMYDHGFLARYHLGNMLDVSNVYAYDEHFTISPNPTFDQIYIEASEIENGKWHLELRDITGRLVLQEDIESTDGAIKKKVYLNDLPAGLYLLQLDNGKERTVSRVVKM